MPAFSAATISSPLVVTLVGDRLDLVAGHHVLVPHAPSSPAPRDRSRGSSPRARRSDDASSRRRFAHCSRPRGALVRRRHGTAIGIGQRDLRLAAAVHARLDGLEGGSSFLQCASFLIARASRASGTTCRSCSPPRRHGRARPDIVDSGSISPRRRCSFSRVKLLVFALTALNLLPSIATMLASGDRCRGKARRTAGTPCGSQGRCPCGSRRSS